MEQLWSLMPEFWEGFRVTLLLLAVSGVLALVLGTAIAAMRISPVPVLRGFAAFWTEIARNTPLTLVFFFTAFVLPMLGVRAPFLLLAFVALTYYTSPFVAEALRSGVNGVPVGQFLLITAVSGLGARGRMGGLLGTTLVYYLVTSVLAISTDPTANVFISCRYCPMVVSPAKSMTFPGTHWITPRPGVEMVHLADFILTR